LNPEELFNHCLSVLESPDSVTEPTILTPMRAPGAIPDYIFHLTNRPEDALLFAQICFNCTRFDVIKVMKSGIFHKGGLRGKPLSQGYQVYYFKDLVATILRATSKIVKVKPNVYLRYYTSAFDRAINQIERLKSIALNYSSKRSKNTLDRIKRDLEKIKSEILAKPVTLPSRFKEGEDTVDSLISLFKGGLPLNTPKRVISRAISILLSAFNIFVEEEAIRQRMTRAERK
jgi:hypothetical protein